MSLIQELLDDLYDLFASERTVYARHMLRAIDEARTSYWNMRETKYSKTDGLRVIRRFEEVNGIKFNPRNNNHVYVISGHASNESFFRKIRKHRHEPITEE